MVIRSDHVTTVFGMRGSGKTTLGYNLVSRFLSVVIWDYGRDFITDAGTSKIPSATIITEPKEIQPGRVQILPRKIGDSTMLSKFEPVCRRCIELGNMMLFVDEAMFVMPNKRELDGYVREMVFWGRHRNCGLLAISQRPANVSTDLRAQAYHRFFLHLEEPSDLDVVKEMAGDENARAVTALSHDRVLYVGDGRREILDLKSLYGTSPWMAATVGAVTNTSLPTANGSVTPATTGSPSSPSTTDVSGKFKN